jgi:hypothetical protein
MANGARPRGGTPLIAACSRDSDVCELRAANRARSVFAA